MRETCEVAEPGLDGGFDEGLPLITDPDFETRPIGVVSEI